MFKIIFKNLYAFRAGLNVETMQTVLTYMADVPGRGLYLHMTSVSFTYPALINLADTKSWPQQRYYLIITTRAVSVFQTQTAMGKTVISLFVKLD